MPRRSTGMSLISGHQRAPRSGPGLYKDGQHTWAADSLESFNCSHLPELLELNRDLVRFEEKNLCSEESLNLFWISLMCSQYNTMNHGHRLRHAVENTRILRRKVITKLCIKITFEYDEFGK